MSVRYMDCPCPCVQKHCHPSQSESDSQEIKMTGDSGKPAYQTLTEAPKAKTEAIALLPTENSEAAMLTFEPDASHYQVYSVLSSCYDSLGMVYLARHLPSGSLVALKKFDMDACGEELSFMQQEILLAKQLQHTNLLPCNVAFVVDLQLWVVVPLMAYGSANDLIANHFADGLPEQVIAFLLRDVLQALDYLHKKGYIHRSVRASHILVSASGKACLSGLRYTCPIIENGRWQRAIHLFPDSMPHNLNWLSPEVLEQNLQGYNEKSDVYSIGITACELANGIVPFAHMPSTLLLTEKLRGSAPQLLDSKTLGDGDKDQLADSGVGDSVASDRLPAAKRSFSEAFHQFVALCLKQNPILRPNAGQLLHHSFFRQCRRSGVTLTDLLHPATPICDHRPDSSDQLPLDLTTEQLSKLEISCAGDWNF